jgi:2,5-diketo-D-gluconate reductase A
MAASPTIELNNGVEIPQLGFGTYLIKPHEAREAVLAALEVGYRHIDTAQMYGNERQVGEAVRASGLDRGDVFVTSKLNNGFHAHDDALKAFERTLDEIDLGHLDLFLIHWPLPGVGDFVETWRAMEEMYASGRVRAIGVSNFGTGHLRRLLDGTEIVPAVNQIEAHPYLVQDELRAFGAANGIATEAWSPIARGRVNDDPVIRGIAERHGRTPAQVTLRWHLQRGDIVFPKSVTRSRVEENFDVFGFELTGEEIAAITDQNRDERLGPDPDTFNWVP